MSGYSRGIYSHRGDNKGQSQRQQLYPNFVVRILVLDSAVNSTHPELDRLGVIPDHQSHRHILHLVGVKPVDIQQACVKSTIGATTATVSTLTDVYQTLWIEDTLLPGPFFGPSSPAKARFEIPCSFP